MESKSEKKTKVKILKSSDISSSRFCATRPKGWRPREWKKYVPNLLNQTIDFRFVNTKLLHFYLSFNWIITHFDASLLMDDIFPLFCTPLLQLFGSYFWRVSQYSAATGIIQKTFHVHGETAVMKLTQEFSKHDFLVISVRWSYLMMMMMSFNWFQRVYTLSPPKTLQRVLVEGRGHENNLRRCHFFFDNVLGLSYHNHKSFMSCRFLLSNWLRIYYPRQTGWASIGSCLWIISYKDAKILGNFVQAWRAGVSGEQAMMLNWCSPLRRMTCRKEKNIALQK